MASTPSVSAFRAPERIRRRIRSMLGTRWKSGERLPPVRTLAEMLGEGRSATHQAVKMLVSEGLLIAKPSIGTVVCDGVEPMPDTPVADATELELRRRNIVILHTKFEPLFVQIAEKLRNELGRLGFTAASQPYNIKHQQEQIQASHTADAVVLINPAVDQSLKVRPGQHLLMLTTSIEGVTVLDDGFDVVACDVRHGGFLAGRFLRSLSAGPACFVGGTDHRTGNMDATSAARLAGFEQGWGESLKPDQIFQARYYVIESAAEVVPRLMQRMPRPDAVFCASDEIAAGVAIGSLGLGLKAGRDYQLVGFDGQERTRNLLGAPLTSVVPAWDDMIAAACELITRRARQPDRPVHQIRIGCTLAEGATTAKR